MNSSQIKKTFIISLRLYPLFIGALFLLGFLLGAFSGRKDSILGKDAFYTILEVVLLLVPIGAMIAFLFIGNNSDKEYKRNSQNQENFNFEDAFSLPNEKMHGYKLANIVGREPTFMGLTGDLYNSDDTSKCEAYPEHVPPVKDCQCGFHAFKNLGEATFERSIYRTAFLFDVDLYGLGFEYQRGFRAESQVINQMLAPTRCMFCKTLPAKKFVAKYEFEEHQPSMWRWQLRCNLCSILFKPENTLSIDQMSERLKIKIF